MDADRVGELLLGESCSDTGRDECFAGVLGLRGERACGDGCGFVGPGGKLVVGVEFYAEFLDLRFESGADEVVHLAIAMGRAMFAVTCERCLEFGQLAPGGSLFVEVSDHGGPSGGC